MPAPTSDPTLDLAKQLIARPSITPNDEGCQTLLIDRLKQLGFRIEHLDFADQYGQVKNFWARRNTSSPCLAFAGHTDVVPVGDPDAWISDPFTPTTRNGRLYGRGSADMKSSLAAFITGIEAFLAQHPNHHGSLALLITSDEEGPATCGTRKVMTTLQARGEKIDYCVVGEPSSSKTLADTIKNGRRGSLGCQLSIIGVQGHIAYPHLADNPIHHAGVAISALTHIEWDQGNQYFPATSLQISNIAGGTGATNVIPERVLITFNLRFSTEINATQIKQKVQQTLDELELKYELDWTLFGEPFITPEAELVAACRHSIKANTGIETTLSTSGGTSDGRFIAPSGAQVVELGPVNDSIHKIDEYVDLHTPAQLSKIYTGIMQTLLT